jgi:hypothetical protein
MLDWASNRGLDHVVSWLPTGRSFRVHNRDAFAAQVLPQHFPGIKIRSFFRQLNIYDFNREDKKGLCDFGAYSHKYFVRGDEELSSNLRRRIVKGEDGASPTARIKQSHPGNAPTNSTTSSSTSWWGHGATAIIADYTTTMSPNDIADSTMSSSKISDNVAEITGEEEVNCRDGEEQTIVDSRGPFLGFNREDATAVGDTMLNVNHFLLATFLPKQEADDLQHAAVFSPWKRHELQLKINQILEALEPTPLEVLVQRDHGRTGRWSDHIAEAAAAALSHNEEPFYDHLDEGDNLHEFNISAMVIKEIFVE